MAEVVTEHHAHMAFLSQLHGEIKEIRRQLVGHGRVVDEWASEPMGDSFFPAPSELATQLKPARNWHSDVVITSIVATWPVTSTSAIITLGDRNLVLPPTLGFVSIPGLRMQLEYEDDRLFTIAPAGACSIFLAGYADLARAGNRGTQRG